MIHGRECGIMSQALLKLKSVESVGHGKRK
jgi:hypothetical protein